MELVDLFYLPHMKNENKGQFSHLGEAGLVTDDLCLKSATHTPTHRLARRHRLTKYTRIPSQCNIKRQVCSEISSSRTKERSPFDRIVYICRSGKKPQTTKEVSN
jgi:hypothetical protein